MKLLKTYQFSSLECTKLIWLCVELGGKICCGWEIPAVGGLSAHHCNLACRGKCNWASNSHRKYRLMTAAGNKQGAIVCYCAIVWIKKNFNLWSSCTIRMQQCGIFLTQPHGLLFWGTKGQSALDRNHKSFSVLDRCWVFVLFCFVLCFFFGWKIQRLSSSKKEVLFPATQHLRLVVPFSLH